MTTNRLQASAAGLAFGAVLSVPPFVVLAVVTGEAGEAVAAWAPVAAPLWLLGAGLGALAGGRRQQVPVPVEVRARRDDPTG